MSRLHPPTLFLVCPATWHLPQEWRKGEMGFRPAGAWGRGSERRLLGMACFLLCTGTSGGHKTWVGSRFGVTWFTQCPAQGTVEECACLTGCRSLRGWNVARQGSQLPLPFCCVPWTACVLECQQAGNCHSKDFPQSGQQIPAGAWGQLPHGQGLPERARGNARAAPAAPPQGPRLSPHPL